MMLLISSFLAAGMLSIATALPITDSALSQLERRQAVTCPSTGNKQFLPVLRTINDDTTDHAIFHVKNDTATGGSEISQVITFSSLPATSTNYYLQWAQSASPTDFTSVGGGTVAVYALDTTKLPAEGVLTPEVVEAAIMLDVGASGSGRIGSAAFGGWPDSAGPLDHLVGDANATSTTQLSFRLTLQEPGDVHMLQDADDGWFLSYDC